MFKWHRWAGGSIKAGLRRGSCGSLEYELWKQRIAQIISLILVDELLVRVWGCSSVALP